MPPPGLGSAPTRLARGTILVVVAVLAAVGPGTGVALAATAVPTAVAVAPTCMASGVPTRTVIIGAGWSGGVVTLSQNQTVLGTAAPRTSPVRQQAGSFSFSTTITATATFQITAQQGDVLRSVGVAVQSSCPLQISVKPPCLSGPGPVDVSGSGFTPGSQVPIDVDPFGDSEALPLSVTADRAGAFSTSVNIPFTGATVPIIATRPSTVGTAVVAPGRAVAFVDPCPPPPTTTTTTTATTTTTRPLPGATTTSTTASVGATTTTTVAPPGSTPPGVVPPVVPPVTIPVPGATARVTISPTTVRPGRCNVIVVSAAPPGLAVIVRFADGPPVNGLVGPAGGAVLSVCESHDSGNLLGPVKVLVGIGPLAPAPVFTILRVPARPEPPLLQAGADDRRS